MPYRINYSEIDPHQLNVFGETRKRKIFVGSLKWDSVKNNFEFRYDPKYQRSKGAIPVGRELDLFQQLHTSHGKLFPTFEDRIPLKENPAYADYCASQGISQVESNPIILLTSIGRRGPSSFVYEPIVKNDFNMAHIKKFRKDLHITINDMALAFDLNQLTLQRLESGKKADLGTIRRIQIYLMFPDVALWQLRLNAGKLHKDALHRLWTYFENLSPLGK